MTEIFNPQIAFRKSQKFSKKYGFILVFIFTLIILLIAGYLIYIYYLSPQFELQQLLPKNYDISLELKTDRFTLPMLQKRQLLENGVIKEIYQEIQQEVEKNLQNLPAEAGLILKRFPHFIFFSASPQSFGFIGEITDKKMIKRLNVLKINGWQSQTIKKRVFIASNDENLIKEMLEQKLSATSIPYFSIAVSPWLKINVQKNFFNQKYPGIILSDLQQIFEPLSFTNKSHSLTFKNSYKTLEVVLTPENFQKQENLSNLPSLSRLLSYLPIQSPVIFGLSDLNLMASLEKNDNLRNLFQQFDSYLWQNYQISLSNLIKEIKGPLLASFENNQWRVITNTTNKNLAEFYIKQHFGQFKPKTDRVILPDNTFATELINNPEAVVFEEKTQYNWQYYLIADFTSDFGYAVNDNLLIIGNNLPKAEDQPFVLDCQVNNITGILKFKPQESLLKSSNLLKKFSEITILGTDNQQIKICFKL